ncbi:MAG TPA: preprotein translocase subunit SecG [Burkholderiales bacterium]|jgi:preprotein translocase subunit SecG|nr:preprotein translocase subunit SecG [Burkholderiales bacterium]
MEIIVLVLHVLTALCVIGLVLLQHGKGADMGAAFGSGSAGSLFGASGSANFLSRSTAVLATVFFLTSLGLSYFSAHKGEPQGVMSTHGQQQVPASTVPTPSSAPAPAREDTGSKAEEIPK